MRKKQLCSVLLAWTLTAAMLPVPAYAQEPAAIEDAQSEVMASVSPEAQEAPEAQESPETGDVPAADTADVPPAETPSETPAPTEEPEAEAPVETSPADPTQEPAADTEVPENPETQAEEPGVSPAAIAQESPVPTVEAQAGSITVKGNAEQTFATLSEALQALQAGGEVTLQIKNSLEIGETVHIPASLHLTITPAEDAEGTEVQIRRAADFAGDMFSVDAGADLTFEQAEGSSTALLLDGSGAEATGSVVNVSGGESAEAPGGSLVLGNGVTVSGNQKTSGYGGAVYCGEYGKVTVRAATVTGNSAEQGGAVYSLGTLEFLGGTVTGNTASGKGGGVCVVSPGTVSVQGSVNITGNTSGGAGTNLLIHSGTTLRASAALEESAGIGVEIEDGAAGRQVVDTALPDGVTMGDVVARLTYDNPSFTINAETGVLEAAVTGSPVPSLTPTVSVTPEGTVTPTVTPKPVVESGALKYVSYKWLEHNALQVTCNYSRNGWCYYKVIPRGSSDTAVDTSGEGAPVVKNQNFDINLMDEDIPDTDFDVVIRCKNKTGEYLSKILQVQFSQARRPAQVTPTPTGSATRDPLIYTASQSTVRGLSEPIEFYPNQAHDFQAIGAGTDNTNPVEGDVQWRPVYWSTVSNPSASQQHGNGANGRYSIKSVSGIRQAAQYNLFVFYQRYVYQNGQWVAQDRIESVTYQFRSAAIEFNPSATPQITEPDDGMTNVYNGGSGYDSGSGYSSSPETYSGSSTTDTGASSVAGGADTADESQPEAMLMLAVLSMMAGVFALTKKRRRQG